MNIPKLVVNPSHLHPDDFYQITNISEDKQYFDFMGFKHLSINNSWAASIIKDRMDSSYYDNLEYDLTSDELDQQDIHCIMEGITESENTVALDWDKLTQPSELPKGDNDMTKEEIDKYVMETYHVSYDDMQKDNEILKRHQFILEQFNKLQENKIKQETKQEIKTSDTPSENTQEKVVEDSIQQENQETNSQETKEIIIPDNIQLIDDVKSIYSYVIKDNGSIDDINNYLSFTEFFHKILNDDFEKNKNVIKQYVKDTCKTLNIGYKDKKVYKGVLKFIALELSNRNIINKIYGEDIDRILHSN